MKTTLFNRLTAGLLAAVLCLSVLAGCAAKPQKELTRYSTIFYDVFDTVTQVIAYCESEEEFTKQMEALHADLISYNQLYDIYNDYDGVVNVKAECGHGQCAEHLAQLPRGRREPPERGRQHPAHSGGAGSRSPAL